MKVLAVAGGDSVGVGLVCRGWDGCYFEPVTTSELKDNWSTEGHRLHKNSDTLPIQSTADLLGRYKDEKMLTFVACRIAICLRTIE